MCSTFHCLPSQLEKEDSKTIESFIIIENELITEKEEEMRRMEAEAKFRLGKF